MNKQQEARAHRDLVAVLSMTPVERREFSRMSRLVTDGIFDAVHPVLEDEDTTCPWCGLEPDVCNRTGCDQS